MVYSAAAPESAPVAFATRDERFMSMRLRLSLVAAAALVVTMPALAGPAYARGHGGGGTPPPSSGFDISYPQCGATFPTGALFGVVGVNGGRVYKPNPCLGTSTGPSELAWADSTPSTQFYANTADPGPAYSSYWTIAAWNNSPQTCASTDPNSTGCSFDYGWYAAADSFNNAVLAEEQVHGLAPSAAASAAASAPWWLDVETGNSWQSQESDYSGNLAVAYANDTAALEGAADYLKNTAGVVQVGFYSTGYQWTTVTGGTGALFESDPEWVAGFSSAKSATNGCTATTGFAGGRIALTQYVANGFDADHQC